MLKPTESIIRPRGTHPAVPTRAPEISGKEALICRLALVVGMVLLVHFLEGHRYSHFLRVDMGLLKGPLEPCLVLSVPSYSRPLLQS